MEQGKCPKCNSDNLSYETILDDGRFEDAIYYPTECFSCGWTGKEVYTLKFAEYIDD